MKKTLIHFPLSYSKTSLLLGFSFLVFFIPFIFKLEMDFSAQAWFSKEDAHIAKLNDFELMFGNDERLMILVEFKEMELFSTEALILLEELTEKLWQIPEVIRVESLSNFHWSYADGDTLVTEPFLPTELLGESGFLEQRKQDALNHRIIPGLYFSKDLKSAIVYGRIAFNPDIPSNVEVIAKSGQDLIDQYKSDSRFKLHLLGEPILNHTFQSTSFKDLWTMLPILFLLLIFYLAYCFRSWIGVLIPLGITIASILVTLGIAGFLGFKANSLTFILPSVLMAISIADSIHLLATFFNYHQQGETIRESALKSIDKNLYPIFLTSVSTAIGFASLLTSNVIPVRDLGLLAALGTLAAMIFSYLLVIPILVLLVTRRERTHKEIQQRIISREWSILYFRWIDRHKSLLIMTFIIISLLGGYLGFQNTINSNPYKYFKPDIELSIANQFTLDHYGGVGGPEIMIDSGIPEGVKDPLFLKRVEEFQEWIQDLPEVNKAVSVVNILKEMNQALFQGDPQEYRLHDKQDVIAQELFLYTLAMPLGLDINNQIDIEQRRLRMSVLWSLQNSQESLEQIDLIEDKINELDLDASITGKGILFQKMNNYVVHTFFTSMAMALLLITIMLMAIFKSFKLGLLSLIPNFVPVVLGAGLLTLLGIPIDIGCAIVASVTLGIIVDDTIHFLIHYQKLQAKGVECFDALVEVMTTTGLALVITTVILVSCFGIFVFSTLTPNKNFGLLCAFIITMALVCDLLVMPAILLMVDQFKKTKQKA